MITAMVLTNCWGETTARDAFLRDDRVFCVADATATVNDQPRLVSGKDLA